MPRLSTLYNIDYTLKNGYNSIKFMSTIKLTNLINFTHAKLILMLDHILDMSYDYFSNYLCLQTMVLSHIVSYYFI